MKKFILFFAVFIMTIQVSLSTYADEVKKPNEPELRSASAMLMDLESGRILYEKDADTKRYPASTTKIMTGLIALERLDMAAVQTASQTAVNVDRDGSNMGVLAGEELTTEQLLYGLLVHSANDAANVLAESVSGSIEAFVAEMNTRAQELGMKNTLFTNPHGYHDDNHYTTTRDLAILSQHAMQNATFRKIVATATYQIPPTNKYKQVRYLSNNNALINPQKGRQWLYSAARGIKTGHTSKAGYCLTSYAEKDDMKLVCVTMNSPINETNNSFKDTINLFEYGFNNFKVQVLANVNEVIATKDVKWAAKGEQAIFYVSQPFAALMPINYDKEKLVCEVRLPDTLKAPINKGEALGKVVYSYDGTELGSVDLVTVKDIKKSYFKMIFSTFCKWVFNAWVMVPLTVIVIILLIKRSNEIRRQKMMRQRRMRSNRKNFYR